MWVMASVMECLRYAVAAVVMVVGRLLAFAKVEVLEEGLFDQRMWRLCSAGSV